MESHSYYVTISHWQEIIVGRGMLPFEETILKLYLHKWISKINFSNAKWTYTQSPTRKT
jgi:hypothetical protein